MRFTYIRVAVAVAPAASVPLLPTPLKKTPPAPSQAGWQIITKYKC